MKRALVSVCLVCAGFAGGLIVAERTRPATGPASEVLTLPAAAAQPAPAPAVDRPKPAPAAAAGPDFTRVAAAVVKGVANISSLHVVSTPNSPFANDPFFRYFFGDDQFFGSRDRRSLSLGSGVMISSDGYLVTNNHVVGENVREITVALPNKKEVRGKVIGTDPATDIALLKIDVTGAPVVPWGDSDQLKVGEWVLAVGSPFQLSQTVTAGIVSATGRTNVGFAQYEDFIQTDAAINPGNSGGALINTRGQLVGINTGIFSQSGGYQGIGFAVPSNLARRVVGELRQYGMVRRGSVGYLQVDRLTDDYAQELGAANTNGALVTQMMRNSEAYDAGIRPGDIIVGFNGQTVDDPSQFFRFVADSKIGSTATIRVLRKRRTLQFKLAIVSTTANRSRQ